MAKGISPYVSFNGGEIGKEINARTQIENYGATAAILENIWPEAAGPMSKRPGLGFKVELGAQMYLRKWVYGIDNKFLMAIGDNVLKIIQNGAVITRAAVTSTVTNGNFASAIGTGWSDISDVSGLASISGGQLLLNSDGTNRAAARQQVTTSSPNQRHALNIVVTHGPVMLKIGSALGLSDYLTATTLRSGTHALGFTPAGSYWIEIWSAVPRQTALSSCVVASAGDLVLPTPWLASDFTSLRFQQSRDVMYVAGPGSGAVAPQRVEHRAADSWSITSWDYEDGPFLSPNLDDSLTLTPSVIAGNGTLTANRNYFQPGHVGALFQLTHQGQKQIRTVVANEGAQFTDPIRVTGIDEERNFSYTVAGTFTGTIGLQRSYQDDTSFTNATDNLTGQSRTTAGTTNVDEDTTGGKNDNIVFFYRLGVSNGALTVGSAVITLNAPLIGSQVGIVRVTGYVSPTVVNVEVLIQLSDVSATSEWIEGQWSGVQGYQRAVSLFDDRLWTGYLDQYWASQTSLYETMATGEKDGDAIWRNISTGDVGKIQWILPLSRVVFGTDAAEDVVRSSAFDDPITPTNLTVRDISSWGSADVEPEKVDSRGLFIDRSTIHAMELAYSSDIQDYVAKPLTRLHKNIGRPGLGQICVARRPETRLFVIRTDGQVLTKLYDPGENVLGWSRMLTPNGGKALSVETLPGSIGSGEDEVYFVVKRRIQGVYRYYLEQLGNIYSATAADANCVDAYVRVDQPAINAVSFNGAAYLSKLSDLTGNANGQKGTVSFWVNFDPASDGRINFVYQSAGLVIWRDASGVLQFQGFNVSSASCFQGTCSQPIDSSSGWTHVMATWDLSASKYDCYINGQFATGSSATPNDTIDYTQSAHYIGGSGDPTTNLVGSLSHVSFDFTAYTDFSIPANREKFISSGRVPVKTAAATIIQLHGTGDTYGTNSGSGGNFTINGFFDDVTPPAPYLAATSKIVSGLSHLEGQTVSVWADGYDLGDEVVAGGQITLLVQPAQVAVGLNYLGRYQSSRLVMQASDQAQLSQPQHIALIFARSSRKVLFGTTLDPNAMDDISQLDLALETDDEDGLLTGITESMPVPGDKNRDPRLCLIFPRPDPVTLAGYVLGLDVNGTV